MAREKNQLVSTLEKILVKEEKKRAKQKDAGCVSGTTAMLSPAEEAMLSVLSRDCCALPVSSRTVTVLHEPPLFYDILCSMVSTAEEEITLCALYIGDGPLAKALVKRVCQRAREVVEWKRKERKAVLLRRKGEGRLAAPTVEDASIQEEGSDPVDTSSTSLTAMTSSPNSYRLLTPFRIRIVMDYHRMRDRRNLETIQPLLSLVHELEDHEEKHEDGEHTRTKAEDLLDGPLSEEEEEEDVEDSSPVLWQKEGDNMEKYDAHTTSQTTGVHHRKGVTKHLPSASSSTHTNTTVPLSGTAAPPSHRLLQVDVSLYHHPHPSSSRLSGMGRVSEALGVQHAKVFSTDTRHTIITGANLSDDYFTKRMDRYLVVRENRYVGHWFSEVVKSIASASHPVDTLEHWGKKHLPEEWKRKIQKEKEQERIKKTKEERKEERMRHGKKENEPVSILFSCPYLRTEPKQKGGLVKRVLSVLLHRPSLLLPCPPPPASSSASGAQECAACPWRLPLWHERSGLVILPNRTGYHPSRDYTTFIHREQEILVQFARRMRARYKGIAEDLLGTRRDEDETEERAVDDEDHEVEDSTPSEESMMDADEKLRDRPSRCRVSLSTWSNMLYDTVIFPTLQCGPAGIFHDSTVVESLLRLATTTATNTSPAALSTTTIPEANTHLFMTSPYMNLYASYIDALLGGRKEEEDDDSSPSDPCTSTTTLPEGAATATKWHSLFFDCITASVKTNSWNNVKGAKFIPQSYLQLERAFWYLLNDFGYGSDRVRLWEFSKEGGYSFHSKGMWFVSTSRRKAQRTEEERAPPRPRSPPIRRPPPAPPRNEEEEREAMKRIQEENLVGADPYLVGYGSTNYGYRSVYRDMEVAMFMFTTNAALRRAWREDLEYLLSQSTLVNEARDFKGRAMGRYQPVISLIAQLIQNYL